MKGWRMSCDVGKGIEGLENELDVGKAMEGLEKELWRRWSDGELILQAFSHFIYVTAHSHSQSFLSLHLRHSSFSNPSLALPTSQLFLQRFRCFTYVTAHSPTLLSLLLRHRIFTYVTGRAAHVLKWLPIQSDVITRYISCLTWVCNTCTNISSLVMMEKSKCISFR